MASKREKGKIPHSEWPNILERYSKGDTIAQIGRDYGCTAPAIRYIVKRNGMLKEGTAGARVAEPGSYTRASAPVAEGGERVTWARAADAPLVVAPSQRLVRDAVLSPELRQRVSGDVASFLVALDHVVLEGSLESVSGLQEATEQLMRSVARTRLELERVLNQAETTRAGEKGRRKLGMPQRST